jgi:cytochrome c peroxidase
MLDHMTKSNTSRRGRTIQSAAAVASLLLCVMLVADDNKATAKKSTVPVPLGLLPIEWPSDNLYSPEKAELGRLLYFDTRLSSNNKMSCASCHAPEHAYTDAAAYSTGIHGEHSPRSSPTVLNRAYSLAQFWDGRAATLEEQAKAPLANPVEFGTNHREVVAKLNGIAGYRLLFERSFGSAEVTIDNIAKAIATFERTLLSGNSPYDRYKAGNKAALTPSQVRGLDVFVNKAKCDQCHEGINFTSNSYHNLGVGSDQPNPDVGRFEWSKDPKDWGAFKTPGLRDIARTAPYMHDGSLGTLEEVVEFYDKGGKPNQNLDEKIKPLKLTDVQKKDLVEFLKSLNGDGWQRVAAPSSFPQ